MNNFFKTVSALVSVFITTISFAQAPAEPAACCDKEFKIDWTATASLYDLDAGNIFVIDNRFSTKITDQFTVGVGVPIINNDNQASASGLAWQLNNGGPEFSGTGFSDIDFFFGYDLWNGKCSLFEADAQVDLIGGVKAPVDGNFSSSDPVFYVGGVAELSKDKWSLTQGAKYEFVDDYTFNPVFGGFIDGDVLALDTKFMYSVNDGIDLGVVANQQYTDGSGVLLLGPAMNAKWNSLDIDISLGFAVVDDIPYDELGAVVSFGIGYTF